jgi:hypothetical protein
MEFLNLFLKPYCAIPILDEIFVRSLGEILLPHFEDFTGRLIKPFTELVDPNPIPFLRTGIDDGIKEFLHTQLHSTTLLIGFVVYQNIGITNSKYGLLPQTSTFYSKYEVLIIEGVS